MMKTAMKELLEELENLYSLYPSTGAKQAMRLAQCKLETERQQLADATSEGYKMGFNDGTDYGKSII